MTTPLKRLRYIGILILFFLSCSKNNSPVPLVTPVDPVVPLKDCKIIAAAAVAVNGDTVSRYHFNTIVMVNCRALYMSEPIPTQFHIHTTAKPFTGPSQQVSILLSIPSQ